MRSIYHGEGWFVGDTHSPAVRTESGQKKKPRGVGGDGQGSVPRFHLSSFMAYGKLLHSCGISFLIYQTGMAASFINRADVRTD